MIHLALFFLFFMGVGAFLANLSPYVISNYPGDAELIFLSFQLASPVGMLLAGYISDKTKLLRMPLCLSLLGYGLCQFLFFAHLPTGLTVVSCTLMRIGMSASGQLITIASLEKSNHRFAFSRSAGTIGFCLIQFILYGFYLFPGATTFDAAWLAQAGGCFILIAGFFAFKVPVRRQSEEHYYFKETIGFLRHPSVIHFFVISFLFYACYQLVDFYIGRYMELKHGLSYVYLGWGFSVVLEIILMPFTAHLFDRFHVKTLFLGSILAGGLRYLCLSLAMYDSGLPVVYSQFLHGLHFTGYYTAAIYLLKRTFPQRLYGTGFALYSVLAVSTGGIFGNMITARMIRPGNSPDDFYSVFWLAAATHVLLILGIILLKLPDSLQEESRESASSYAVK